MTMLRTLAGYTFLATLLAVAPAFAEEATEKTNPVMQALHDFSEKLPPAEQRHANVIFSNYNIISVVETVKDSIEMAAKACGKENPDLKEPIEKRFEEWENTVNPLLKEAEANIDNMIAVQDYAKPKEIRSLLKKIDKSREDQNKMTDKVPVKTAESCQYLLQKMDETQPGMVKFLEATLVSLPMSIQEEHDEALRKAKEEREKAEAEAEAAENAAEKADEEQPAE